MANGHDVRFLTIKEGAHAIRMTERTLARYIRDGLGPRCSKFGRRIRIHADTFEQWVRRGIPAEKGK